MGKYILRRLIIALPSLLERDGSSLNRLGIPKSEGF